MTFKKKALKPFDEAASGLPILPPAEDNATLDGPPIKKTYLCGHINRHFVNSDGVREDLPCTLPVGHGGDHSAPYACLRAADGSIAQARAIAAGTPTLKLSGRVVQGVGYVPNQYVEVTETAYWLDGASIPPEQIRPDLEQLARIKRTKGDMLDAAQLERRPVL